FLSYIVGSRDFVRYADAASKGVKMPRVERMGLRELNVARPDLPTQTRIADYLDRETGEIDAKLATMDELTETLEVRRDAVITEAVTSGIDGPVEAQTTTIPGAHVVPAHWNVLPLQLAFEFQEGPGILSVDFRDNGVPLLRISGVRGA